MKKLLQSIVLFVTAVLLSALMFPVGILFCLYRTVFYFKKSTPVGYLAYVWFALAVAIDTIGNVVCGPLFNVLFIEPWSKIYFGSIEHTVSLIIGYNKRNNHLKFWGKVLYVIIEKLDPGHFENCIRSFEDKELRTSKYFY
jgi:hypothetical protein